MWLEGMDFSTPLKLKFCVSASSLSSVGKGDFSLTQYHQPLKLGAKKSPLGFVAAAFGLFSNGKIHSEFQAIAFEFSLWKMTYISAFCWYVSYFSVLYLVKVLSSS